MAITLEDIRKYREEHGISTEAGIEAVRAARERIAQGLPVFPTQKSETSEPSDIRQSGSKFSEKIAHPAKRRAGKILKAKAVTGSLLGAENPDAHEKKQLTGVDQNTRAAASAAKRYGVAFTGDPEETLRAAGREAYINGRDADSDSLYARADTIRTEKAAARARELADKAAEEEQKQLQAYIDKYARYAALTYNPDFAEKSRYQTTANGKEEFNNFFQNYSNTGFDDIAYDYINRNETAIKRQELADIQDNAAFLGLDQSERLEMTDDEIAIFNYLYAQDTAKGDTEHKSAYDFVKLLTGSLTARQRAKAEEEWAAYARENPTKMSAFSVLESPMKGLAYLGQAVDYLADGKIDQNAGYNKFSYSNSAIRNQVSQMVEDKWGGVGTFAYQTGMSMGDFLLNTAITGGNEALSLAIMGTGAAADATIAAKDRGLSDNQSFALGTIAGAAEIITEKVSIETLLDKTSLSESAFGYFLKNVLAEGSEEVGSDIINLVADVLISKDKSEWQTSMDAYERTGMTEKEAFWHAVEDQAANMGLDFLGGAVSGGVMAGAGIGINSAANRLDVLDSAANLRDSGDLSSMLLSAMNLQNEALRERAFEMADAIRSGKKPSAAEVRDFYTALSQERARTRGSGDYAAPEARQGAVSADQNGRQLPGDLSMANPEEQYLLAYLEQENAQETVQAVEEQQPSTSVRAAEERQSTRQQPSSTPPVKAENPFSASLTESLGENGKAAYHYTIEHSDTAEDGVRPAFLAYYTYGLAGSNMENVPAEFARSLGQDGAYRAWAAGQNDAKITLAREQKAAKYAAVSGTDSGLVYDDFVREAVSSGRSRVDVNGESRGYLTAETAEQLNQVARALGVRVQFADSIRGGTANAKISGSTILMEKNNPNPVMAVVGHEFTHRMQELAPREYRTFRNSVLEGKENRVREKLDAYASQGVNLTYEEAMDEAAADLAGLMMDDGKVLDQFIEKHRTDRTLLQKIRDAIRSFIDKLTGKERKKAETTVGKLEAALDAAAKQARALQDKAGRDTMDVTRHSLKEDGDYGITEENHRAAQSSGNHRDSGYDAQQRTTDTGRSGQNRQGVGGEVRPEVGTTIRREDFLREHRERGDRSVRLKGDYLYAYHEATEAELNDNAKKTVAILKDLGIPYFTNTDGIHIYANGEVRISNQSVTIHDGTDTKIAVSANMETEGAATAYHEAFHFMRDAAPALRNKLQGTIRGSIVENESYETFSSRIAEAYRIPLDPSQRAKVQEAKFQEELNAYICGEIMAQKSNSEALHLIKDFVKNPEQLLIDVAQMYTDFKAQQKGETNFSLKTGTITKSYEAILEENRLLKEQMKDYRDLRRKHKDLRKSRDYWWDQTKTTESAAEYQKAVAEAAKGLVEGHSSKANVLKIQGKLQGLYDTIGRWASQESSVAGDADYEKIQSRAESIARELVEQAVVRTSPGDSYQELLDYLKTTEVVLGKKDQKGFPGINGFKARQQDRLNLSIQGKTNIDQVYQELSERWPEFFDEAEQSHPADQLLRVGEVLDQLYAVEEYNPFEGEMDQAVTGAANEIMERFFDLPQTRKTFADRQEARLSAAKANGKQQVQKVREEYKARLDKLREQNRQRVADTIDKERAKRDQKIQALKDRYAARDAAGKARQEARKLRSRIIRHVGELSRTLLRPNDKKHIPETLRTAVSAMLESINLESPYRVDENGRRIKNGTGGPTRRTAAFQALKAEYAKIAAEGELVIDPSLFGDAAKDIQGGFDQVIAMKDIRLADMTLEQLETVWQVVKAVESGIRTEGKVLSKAKYQRTADWAGALQADTASRRAKGSLTSGHIALDLENPYTFFSHYGQAGMDIYRSLRDAQDRQQQMKTQVARKIGELKLVDRKTLRDLEKTAKTFTTATGEKLTLTTAQVMDLYNLSKRQQALGHLLGDGVVQPRVKSEHIRRGTNAIRLTEGDLAAITRTLTAEQKKMADALQELTIGMLADFGNEASMAAYGYKKFTGKDYWPIHVAGEEVQVSVEKNRDNPRSVRNMGMAQSTQAGAANALNIFSVFDSFSDHVSDMTTYAAWLCPMEDMDRLFNYRYRDEAGNRTGKTVKGLLEEFGGPGSMKYWLKLMSDIQNGIGGSNDSIFWNYAGKTVGNLKGAAVKGNARVILQQATAIFKAALPMEVRDLSRGFLKGVTKGSGWEKALQYAPIALKKDDGSFDISSPRQMKDSLFDGRSLLQRADDLTSAPAGKADAWAWGKIWNACEWATAREHKELAVGSDAFYQETARLFTQVIDQTQVVDGVLQRSNIMRSSNEVVKQATSFMGEPIMALNILMQTYDQARYETDPVKRKRAVKKMCRAVSALIVTDVVNALVQSLVDAARDDDRDKDYAEKFRIALLGDYDPNGTVWDNIRAGLSSNLIGNLNPLGRIPFVKDWLSQFQGYEVKRMDTQGIAELFNVSRKWEKLGNGRYTVAYLLKETAASLSKLFGAPVGNIMRDLSATINTTISFADSFGADTVELRYRLSRTMYDVKNSQNLGIFTGFIWEARQKGNEELASEIYNDLGRSGWTREQLDQRVNNLAQKAEKGTAAAQAYVDAEERGSASGMEKAAETAGDLGISDDEFKAMLNKERNRRKEKDEGPEPWEDIGPDYWAGGNVSYSYDNLYQAVLNGDASSVETIRRALEQDGKDAKAIDSAVKSRLRADLKEAFWESGSLSDSEVKKLSRLLADWDESEDAAAYLEKDAWKKWKEAYRGGKGRFAEYKRYYDVLKKVFGYENEEIIRRGNVG